MTETATPGATGGGTEDSPMVVQPETQSWNLMVGLLCGVGLLVAMVAALLVLALGRG